MKVAKFSLTEPLKPLHKLYMEEFFNKTLFQYPIEKERITNDPLIQILNLPKTSEFFCDSVLKDKIWNPKEHSSYTKEFNDIALTLLCIHRFHAKYLDKNIFLMILSLIASNPIYYLEKNLHLISFKRNYRTVGISPATHRKLFDFTPYEQPHMKEVEFVVSSDGLSFKIRSYYIIEDWGKFIQSKFLIPWNYLSSILIF